MLDLGIGGAGVVALYKLGFPISASEEDAENGTKAEEKGRVRFKSDVIFEEIRERAAQVSGGHWALVVPGKVKRFARRWKWPSKSVPATSS